MEFEYRNKYRSPASWPLGGSASPSKHSHTKIRILIRRQNWTTIERKKKSICRDLSVAARVTQEGQEGVDERREAQRVEHQTAEQRQR